MRFLFLAFWLGFQYLAAGQPTAANIVFQSTDGGQTWQDVSAGLPADVTVRQFSAGDGAVYLSAPDGLYRSRTTAATPVWEKQLFLPENSIGIFPGQAGPYACSYGSGIFQELPGTGTWVPMYTNLKDRNVHTLLESPDGTIFVGCESGIYKSADGGKTWKQVFGEGRVWSLTAVDGGLVGGGYRGVLRSTDGGDHWHWVMTEGGAAVSTVPMEDGVAAITYDGSTKRLSTSADGGQTWQHLAEGPALPRFLADLQPAGSDLFCSQSAGIFRSSDRGNTWQLVLPANGKTFILAVSGRVIYAVIGSGC